MKKSYSVPFTLRLLFVLIYSSYILIDILGDDLLWFVDGDYLFDESAVLLIMYLPIWLTALLIPTFWIFRKKIPTSIQIDGSNQLVKVRYWYFFTKEYDIEDLGVELFGNDVYLCLRIKYAYEKYDKGAKFKSVADCLGFILDPAWNKNKLEKLYDDLREVGVRKIKSRKSDFIGAIVHYR